MIERSRKRAPYDARLLDEYTLKIQAKSGFEAGHTGAEDVLGKFFFDVVSFGVVLLGAVNGYGYICESRSNKANSARRNFASSAFSGSALD